MSGKFEKVDYRQICSEKTLQSNSKGFFLDFADFVAQEVGDTWIQNCFGKLQTDAERIRCIYQSNEIKDHVQNFLSNVKEVYRPKDAEFSQKRRLEADELMAQNDFKHALMLYSQSVLRAPNTHKNPEIDSGLTLSLGLWGRAQALMKLKKYSSALCDIKEALKEYLPDTNKSKAYWLMGVCNELLGEKNKADVAYSLTEKMMDSNSLVELQEERKQLVTSNESKQQLQEARKQKPVLESPSKDLSNASKKLTIKTSSDLGRYVVANENISAGETLVVEPPYAACLLPKMFGSNCHHCFLSLEAPYGCPHCSSVAFCSQNCRDEAVSTYHQYECKYLDLLIGSGMSILAHTALRMMTQAGLEKSLELFKNRNKEKLFELCTNAHLRSSEDFLQRTLMAAFLLRCLQKSDFFKSASSNVIPLEEEYQIGEMLLFNLQMLQFNAHEIYETWHSNLRRVRGSKTTYIGVAVYLTASLFNHDCFPALSRHFVGKNIILTSTRPLKSNDIVPENYGPIFTRKTLEERKKSLSARYWFDCQCMACQQDWPAIGKGLESVSKRLRCISDNCDHCFTLPLPKEVVDCPKCKKSVDLSKRNLLLKWCEEQYQAAFELMDQDDTKKAIDILCITIDAFYKISAPPHKETHLAEEMLRICLADSGNTREIVTK
ncbi:SET and MYND domain-containing protein 4 [Anthonomus grandis grandis]|uniref:SET and MYND domain-containing protein 4 n=1 Tax=Anthonomus grandis grandis TaxID=2921223 RepID=UPI0021665E9B|nr:SET and MYND domain-containing protein 4 [Anthonomus grandis grandis]